MNEGIFRIQKGTSTTGGLHLGGGGLKVYTDYLPSGYKMAVGGDVICEELTVQLEGDWPDYVFADEYELMSLEEVEGGGARLEAQLEGAVVVSHNVQAKRFLRRKTKDHGKKTTEI